MSTKSTDSRQPPFGTLVPLKSGHELHYREVGTGPAVVFVHGSGPGANAYSNFSGNCGPIAAAGFRCVLPDLVGFGYSSKPTGIDYSTALFADTLLELLDTLKIERCVLVGNSLGGAIALDIALRYPERVEKLILMAPGGIESRETYFQMPGIQKMVSGFVGAGFDRAGLRRILEMLSYDPSVVTDELVEERFNIYQTQPKDVLARIVIPDVTALLPQIKCPVLGFWGLEDQFCPASGAEKILRAIPDSRFTLYGHCGHWAMIERRDEFNANVINFLKR
ncbi:MAG: alpha/beta hydrolase [Pseudomonadota bacterium]|nr:alpha/beta hydrolase [Pseudomonadota bacterium]